MRTKSIHEYRINIVTEAEIITTYVTAHVSQLQSKQCRYQGIIHILITSGIVPVAYR